VENLFDEFAALLDRIADDRVVHVTVPVIVARVERSCDRAAVRDGRTYGLADERLDFIFGHERKLPRKTEFKPRFAPRPPDARRGKVVEVLTEEQTARDVAALRRCLMPRSILGVTPAPKAAAAPVASHARATTLDAAGLDARLRRPRSQAYLDALLGLDAGGHGVDATRASALAAIVRAEFPELTVEQLPHGFVARCYLGAPFEVHTFDLRRGEIIAHYKAGEPLPGGLERGRAMALHGAYVLVEVYGTEVRGIAPDGRATGPAVPA